MSTNHRRASPLTQRGQASTLAVRILFVRENYDTRDHIYKKSTSHLIRSSVHRGIPPPIVASHPSRSSFDSCRENPSSEKTTKLAISPQKVTSHLSGSSVPTDILSTSGASHPLRSSVDFHPEKSLSENNQVTYNPVIKHASRNRRSSRVLLHVSFSDQAKLISTLIQSSWDGSVKVTISSCSESTLARQSWDEASSEHTAGF